MRNPLKRLARRDPDKPSLRDRLAGAKERYARTLRVHRAMNAPSAPAVSRVALTNYATFLFHERRAVCAELYPHTGRKADMFVLGLNEAWKYFYTSGNDWKPRRDLPQPSTRALKVLDLVGIDWRKDGTEADLDRLHGSDCRDNGERPPLPYGWPAPDAALLAALDDLQRLDAAQAAMHETGLDRRNADTVPGYSDLENWRDDALDRLTTERAECLTGLQAKARALLILFPQEPGGNPFGEIAVSLARDLLGMPAAGVTVRPDPIFAAIDALRLAFSTMEAAFTSFRPGEKTAVTHEQKAAGDAYRTRIDGVLATVPTTGAGCAALARFVADDPAARATMNSDDWRAVLRLIGRSPAF